MKILMLSDSMGRGGTERRLTELLKGLVKHKGYSPELAVFSTKVEYSELKDLQIPIHILKRRIKRDPFIFYKLYQLVRKIKPDIIHSWGSMATIYALPVRWLQPTLLINAIITDAPKFTTWLDPRLLRFRITAPSSDLILANCKAGLDAYRAPNGKSQFIFNGFDFRRLSGTEKKEATRKKYHLPAKMIVGMVGAFAPRKDYRTYLKIAQDVLDTRNDVIFMAVGGGVMLAGYRNNIPDRFKDQIIFTDEISEVEEVIQLFDIGILISNSAIHGEGISNAILEYMAAGKPVIANDNGGNSEIIVDGTTGFIVKDHYGKTWLEKIHFLLDHQKEAHRMGLEGRRRIESTFSIDKMVHSHIHEYNKLREMNS